MSFKIHPTLTALWIIQTTIRRCLYPTSRLNIRLSPAGTHAKTLEQSACFLRSKLQSPAPSFTMEQQYDAYCFRLQLTGLLRLYLRTSSKHGCRELQSFSMPSVGRSTIVCPFARDAYTYSSLRTMLWNTFLVVNEKQCRMQELYLVQGPQNPYVSAVSAKWFDPMPHWWLWACKSLCPRV